MYIWASLVPASLIDFFFYHVDFSLKMIIIIIIIHVELVVFFFFSRRHFPLLAAEFINKFNGVWGDLSPFEYTPLTSIMGMYVHLIGKLPFVITMGVVNREVN